MVLKPGSVHAPVSYSCLWYARDGTAGVFWVLFFFSGGPGWFPPLCQSLPFGARSHPLCLCVYTAQFHADIPVAQRNLSLLAPI